MKISGSVHIEAPVSEVFELFTDLNEIEKRIAGITSIEVLEGSPQMQSGTKWKETRVMFGKEASETMTISDFVVNERYSTDAASHGMEYVSTYTFDAQDNGTLVTMEFVGTPVTTGAKLMIPLGVLFKGATKKALIKDMTDLKAVAEAKSS